ncbi:MAG: BrnT family toxin [Methylococcaceae bacterium]|nr:MAG: BrnT family toxin [Methylococcaceae bacterium]
MIDGKFYFDKTQHAKNRVSYGEQRLQSLAWWRKRVVFLVWTERRNAAHIISCRYANKYQMQRYFAAIQPR